MSRTRQSRVESTPFKPQTEAVRTRLPLLICLLLPLVGCTRPAIDGSLTFNARWGDVAIGCGKPVAGLELNDLRFFLHAVELLGADGPVKAELIDDDYWQQANVAMVDLEDGSGACQNGTGDRRAEVRFRVPEGDYRGIRFTIGVPFELNHADPLTAEPPLDDTAMHWHWRSGYKFIRAGIARGDTKFVLHTGSVACEGTVQDITGCKRPNRHTVELPDYVPGGGHQINVDLAELFRGTDLESDDGMECISAPDDASCVAPFAALGLDFDTGEAGPPQRVFRLNTTQ